MTRFIPVDLLNVDPREQRPTFEIFFAYIHSVES